MHRGILVFVGAVSAGCLPRPEQESACPDVGDPQVATVEDCLSWMYERITALESQTGGTCTTCPPTTTSPAPSIVGEVCLFSHAPGAAAAGGDADGGALVVRPLDPDVDGCVFATVQADTLVLEPGRYLVQVHAAAAGVGMARLRIVDETNGVVYYGVGGQAQQVSVPPDSTEDLQALLYVAALVSPKAQTTYQIEQYSAFSRTGTGLGRVVGDAPEHYLTMLVQRLP